MVTRRRVLRAVGTVVVTGLCIAYLVWKIDIGETLDVLGRTDPVYFAGSLAIMIGSVLPMAWRWRELLRARLVEERVPWLPRASFGGYTASQILPTSFGGDASRIYETARRHPGSGGAVAGTVLLERVLGGMATLLLAAIGFALALGHYDVGAYLWIELAFVAGAVVVGVVLFSRAARRPLSRV